MAKIEITKSTVEALKVTSKDYIAFDTDLLEIRPARHAKRQALLLGAIPRSWPDAPGDDRAIRYRDRGIGATRKQRSSLAVYEVRTAIRRRCATLTGNRQR
jgi:hypothetical protein